MSTLAKMSSLFLLSLFLCSSLCVRCAQPAEEQIYGRLVVPGSTRFRDFRVIVQLYAGERYISAYCTSDGTFTLPTLPPGMHILTVAAVGEWSFPQLLIDVSSRTARNFRISHFESHKNVPVPIVLKGYPISHFEIRKSLNLWAIVRSPYGMIVCGMLFFMFVMPMMQIDPEEYRRAQDTWLASSQQPQATQAPRRRD